MEERFETFTVLITRISRSIKRIKADEMADFELKGPHVSCLYYLSQRDGMTAAELCERCDEDKAAISRSLDDLEKNGYITCTSGAGKRYKSPLRLTERGKAVGRAIGEKITRIVEAASEGLSEAERQTMYRALALVSENLERIYTHKKTAGDRAARDEQYRRKNMSVQIIVDSTVDMPERMKGRFRIVPLTVHFRRTRSYIDGVTIDKQPLL